MPLYVFARDLQGCGLDIVVVEDLATLFGRCIISSMLAFTFRALGFLDRAWDAGKGVPVLPSLIETPGNMSSMRAR